MLSTKTIRNLVLTGCILPALWLMLRLALGTLGANPVAEILNQLGWWTLVLLLATLSCTPLRQLLGWHWPPRVRKTLGLACFAWGLAHFLFYLAIDQEFDFDIILEDLTKRRFIFVGFLALLTLVPLAATSSAWAIRQLGPRAWRRLHRLIYLAGVLALVHFAWRVKLDYREPLIFAAIFIVLTGVRVWFWMLPRISKRSLPTRDEA